MSASRIAEFLSAELVGGELTVTGPASIESARAGALCFIKNPSYGENTEAGALLIVGKDRPLDPASRNSYIPVDNPRLAFARAVAEFFAPPRLAGIAATAVLGSGVSLGESVRIGERCVIEDGVSIGDGTVINHNVVIAERCRIGAGCTIKSNTVIGEGGFGFDFEEDGTPVKLPQLGGVRIGDRVEIGAGCFVARGTLNDTVIESDVKIDSQVHIGHNCRIGARTIVTAETEISGSVTVGRGCWLSPNCTLINNIRIGDRVTVGIGAVVVRDVPDGARIMGLEGTDLWSLMSFKKKTGYPFPGTGRAGRAGGAGVDRAGPSDPEDNR